MNDDLANQLITELKGLRAELHQANVLRAIATPAPNIELPIEQYGKFDLAGIGARAVSSDKDGWTAIAWGMRIFFRRRSSEDDDKGAAIRFSRCIRKDTGGEVWETLLRFRERKPAKKLGEDLRERVNVSASANASVDGPAAVPALPAQSAAVPPAATPKVAQPPMQPPMQPPDLFAEWQAAWNAAEASGHTIPSHYELEADDNPAILANKVAGLKRIAAGELYDAPKPRDLPPPVPNAHRGNVQTIPPLEALRTLINDQASKYQRARPPMTAKINQANDVDAALRAHCGGDEGRVALLADLFERTPNGAQYLALHSYLKPARNANGVFAANPEARERLTAAMAELYAEREHSHEREEVPA